jgi:hypothetical protein
MTTCKPNKTKILKPIPRNNSHIIKIIKTLPHLDWNNLFYSPFKPLFYFYKRGLMNLLYCYIIAYNKDNKLTLLPWNQNGIDMRKHIKEKKLYDYKYK